MPQIFKYKTLKEASENLEVENYFDYIIETKINGQRQQVRNLFLGLMDDLRKDFFNYLESEALEIYDSENIKEVRQVCIECQIENS